MCNERRSRIISHYLQRTFWPRERKRAQLRMREHASQPATVRDIRAAPGPVEISRQLRAFPLFSCRETLARQRRRRRLQRQEQNFTRSITIISVAFFTTCPRLLFQQSFPSFLPNNKKKTHTHKNKTLNRNCLNNRVINIYTYRRKCSTCWLGKCGKVGKAGGIKG